MTSKSHGNPPHGPRIALVHPTYWPEVRRGSERVVHDLARHLADSGARPTILTSHRSAPRASLEHGVRVVRAWRPPARLAGRGREPYVSFAPMALLSTAVRRFDLVHAFHIPAGWAVSGWCRATRTPLVLSLMGMPDETALSAYRNRATMLRRAWNRAAAVHVLSEAARAAADRAFRPGAVVIPPGTRTADFATGGQRSADPLVFCPSSADDPRKRVGLLVEAFAILRRRRPRARLLVGPGAASGSAPVAGIETVNPASSPELARLYSRASVTALPSEREAFGQVLVESMAAGTPVVAFAEGAAPEIVEDGRVGCLCRRAEPSALAETLERGIALSEDTATRGACREHAARWDWGEIGPRFAALYDRVLAGAR